MIVDHIRYTFILELSKKERESYARIIVFPIIASALILFTLRIIKVAKNGNVVRTITV